MDDRIVPVWFTACRKRLPGGKGGGIFSFNLDGVTSSGTFPLDMVYSDQGYADPSLLANHQSCIQFFNRQQQEGKRLWAKLIVKKGLQKAPSQVPTENGDFVPCEYFSPYICVGYEYFEKPLDRAPTNSFEPGASFEGKRLSNPLFKKGLVDLRDVNRLSRTYNNFESEVGNDGNGSESFEGNFTQFQQQRDTSADRYQRQGPRGNQSNNAESFGERRVQAEDILQDFTQRTIPKPTFQGRPDLTSQNFGGPNHQATFGSQKGRNENFGSRNPRGDPVGQGPPNQMRQNSALYLPNPDFSSKNDEMMQDPSNPRSQIAANDARLVLQKKRNEIPNQFQNVKPPNPYSQNQKFGNFNSERSENFDYDINPGQLAAMNEPLPNLPNPDIRNRPPPNFPITEPSKQLPNNQNFRNLESFDRSGGPSQFGTQNKPSAHVPFGEVKNKQPPPPPHITKVQPPRVSGLPHSQSSKKLETFDKSINPFEKKSDPGTNFSGPPPKAFENKGNFDRMQDTDLGGLSQVEVRPRNLSPPKMPKKYDILLERTIKNYLIGDSSVPVALNIEEFEIVLGLAKILHQDAKVFLEHRRHNPTVRDLARKFGLELEASAVDRSDKQHSKRTTPTPSPPHYVNESTDDVDEENVSVDRLDAIHPRMRRTSEFDLQSLMREQQNQAMPPPAAVPSQRRWFESSRSEANLLTATLDRLKPSPSRPLDTADRWRSEQDWHESSNFEENTAQRNFGFDLAPGAERRKPREFSPEIRPEQPKSFADKFKIPDFKSILRMDTVVNPAFKSSFDSFPDLPFESAQNVETRKQDDTALRHDNQDFDSAARSEHRTFDPAPGAERRNLQQSFSMRHLGTDLAPLTTEPLTIEHEPDRSRSSLWSLPSSGLLSRALKRRSIEPVDNASGGLYGKKNFFF